ncbi:MAG: OmpP1/FadL family transporter [Breznakibacter sp.]
MKKISSLLMTLALSTSLYAEGYQVNLQSTKQTGMGHVGSALKLGAESMHFNPGALGFLDSHMDFSVGMAGVFSKAEYNDNKGYKASTDNSVSTPLYGYAAFSIYDNLKAGIGVTTPYGSSMNWGKTWAGGHLVQDISLKAFVVQPTLAYRITPKLSIGGGLMIAKGNVELSRSIIPVGFLVNIPGFGEAYKDVVPVSATLNGNSDVALGYNLGVLYDISDKWSVGISYRSKMKMKVAEGEAELIYASESIKALVGGMVPPLDQGTFKAELPLPANLNIGIAFKATEKMLLSVEYQGVNWEAYDKLSLKFTENVLNGYSIEADKNYNYAYAIRLGGEYAVTERFDARAGFYVDTTPVDKANYNPETPGMTKLGLSAGFSFRPTKNFSIDAAFLAILGMGADGTYQYVNPLNKKEQPFNGSYKSTAYAPSLGFSYKF